MIILDLQNAIYSRMVREFSREEVTEDLMRHLVLDTIKRYNARYRRDFGNLVIASDGRDYWRKKVFPYYKAGRKKARDKSPLDWPKIMGLLNQVRDEIAENFPYPVINLPEAEADDIIATMVMKNPNEQILILSGDHDFKQLQHHSNLKQYDINHRKFVTVNDGLFYLKEHIIRGDPGDGIPNILSPDNSFVIGLRQKPIRQEKIDRWMPLPYKDFCNDEMMRNYERNRALIDLSEIPTRIQDQVLDAYKEQKEKPYRKPFNYIFKHGLSKLMENITDF